MNNPVHGLKTITGSRDAVNKLSIAKIRRQLGKSTVLFILLFPMACSTTTTATSSKMQVISEHGLIPELGETSGLYCDDGRQYTIADSGNSPTLFVMGSDGSVLEGIEINGKNRDWEAITADDDYFYIGDFGNNAGKRNNLAVYKIGRADTSEMQTLDIAYDGYDIKKNSLYAHDYDAEALVAKDNHLVLFSKSWLTNRLKVYLLDKSTEQQTLTPVAEIGDMPGVVTGADWDGYHRRYVVVGYNTNAFGITDPFIAMLSEDFELQSTYTLQGYGQVEGLCIMGQDEIWLTQENSPFSIAKLIKLKLKE